MKTLKIVIVAGEASGDFLAAGLITALRQSLPDTDIQVRGIAGPLMEQAGVQALHPASALSVMGIAEVFSSLMRILRIRRQLIRNVLSDPPDVYIGVDAQDFNLPVEKKLKKHGIRIVHYVSPKIWAWRKDRINTIAKYVDLLLCLFPFELPIYTARGVNVKYVGHPLADAIPLEVDKIAARKRLGMVESAQYVALLPGSRRQEIQYLLSSYLATASHIHQQNPNIRFLLPIAHDGLQSMIQAGLALYRHLPIYTFNGRADDVLAACDVTLVAAGTATLQAMLYKRPMVVAYRWHPISYFLARYVFRIRFYALPNILADEMLVPEFIQQAAQASATLADVVLDLLQDTPEKTQLLNTFDTWHDTLRQQTNVAAAEAIKANFL